MREMTKRIVKVIFREYLNRGMGSTHFNVVGLCNLFMEEKVLDLLSLMGQLKVNMLCLFGIHNWWVWSSPLENANRTHF